MTASRRSVCGRRQCCMWHIIKLLASFVSTSSEAIQISQCKVFWPIFNNSDGRGLFPDYADSHPQLTECLMENHSVLLRHSHSGGRFWIEVLKMMKYFLKECWRRIGYIRVAKEPLLICLNGLLTQTSLGHFEVSLFITGEPDSLL